VSFLNSAIGAMIGFSLGGPIGALLGGVIGSRFGSRGRQKSFSSNQQNQAAFFAALFACLAKLAKADGQVSKEEVEVVDRFIKKKFKFDAEQRAFAIEIFNHAKDDSNSYEEYASQLSYLLEANKNALVVFYELLFELAMSDGLLHKNEEDLLRKTTSIFGINQELFNQLRNQFSTSSSNPYTILGVTKDMPFEEIKIIYLRKRKEFHPDTLISKGLPDELLERAKERFIEIQEAYETIKKINLQ
tara:strand:- start:6396 stop:7130 length:735 start_codon:yes stop_codon:yes gene_type:complete